MRRKSYAGPISEQISELAGDMAELQNTGVDLTARAAAAENAQAISELSADVVDTSATLSKRILTKSSGAWYPRPLVTFTDDDGALEVLTKSKPTFVAKNVPCVTALYAGSQLLASQTYIDAMLDLQNNYNWEIASHSYNHENLADKTEQQIRDDSEAILSLLRGKGFSVESIIYPYGGHDELARATLSEYYRCGVAVTKSGVNTNRYNGNIYDLIRAYFGVSSSATLEQYTALVDEAIANNSWLIFYSHASDENFDANQVTILGQLIDYIKSTSAQIVNLRDGLNYFEPVFFGGEYSQMTSQRKYYTALLKNGHFLSKDAVYCGWLNEFGGSDAMDAYPISTITMHSVNDAGKTGFPNVGTVLTIRGSSPNWDYQMWFSYYGNEIQIRRFTAGAWTTWTALLSTASMPVWVGVVAMANAAYKPLGSTKCTQYVDFEKMYSSGGTQPTLSKTLWAASEISTDSETPTVIGTAGAINVQVYKDANSFVYIKYSAAGNNYPMFIRTSFC